MSTTHLKKSVIAGGNINTIKALKRYWNTPVSDIDDNSSEAKYTVLQMALLLNKRKIVEYMIPQKDLDLTTRATDGTTALMLAVEKEVPLDWLRAMLERGAAENIDAEDHDGRSALDRCKKGSEIYDLLIRYGATPRPPTPPPEPPADPEKLPDSTVDSTASGETVATKAEAVIDVSIIRPWENSMLLQYAKNQVVPQTPNVPFDPNIPPGLEEHPGFWASMCGCGGRQGKHTIETVEPPLSGAGMPKAKAGPMMFPGEKAFFGAKAKAKTKASPMTKAKSKAPAPKPSLKEPPHPKGVPKAAPKAPPHGPPQAAAA